MGEQILGTCGWIGKQEDEGASELDECGIESDDGEEV